MHDAIYISCSYEACNNIFVVTVYQCICVRASFMNSILFNFSLLGTVYHGLA